MAETNTESINEQTPLAWNRQTVLDVLFVLALPTICVVLDPGIISRGSYETETGILSWFGPGFLYEIQLPLYLLFALVITGFWLSFLQSLPSWAATFLRGTLVLGSLLSGLFTLLLAPLAGLLLFFAIGPEPSSPFEDKLLILVPFGFVPIFTAWRFIRRYRTMPRHDTKAGFAPFGFMAPVVLSLALYSGVAWTLDPLFQRLQSSEPDVGLAALSELLRHPICYSGCRDRILVLYCNRKAPFPAKDLPPLLLGVYGNFLTTEENCAFAW